MLMLLLRSYVPYSGLAAASTLQRALREAYMYAAHNTHSHSMSHCLLMAIPGYM
jgi:hypothetical protein